MHERHFSLFPIMTVADLFFQPPLELLVDEDGPTLLSYPISVYKVMQ